MSKGILEILNSTELQYENHTFPLGMMQEGSWGIDDWIKGYRDYWTDKSEVEQDELKKEVFEKIGLYDEDLVRNQDDELNGRLIQSGGKIILITHIILEYYARDTIKKVFSMFYQYGFFKPLVNKKLKSPTSFRQFIPLFFVLGILICPLLGIFNNLFFKFTLYSISFYLLLLLMFSLKITINKNLKFSAVIFLILTFFTIHWSYGWGYINGILKLRE